jgi:hypothetical protein
LNAENHEQMRDFGFIPTGKDGGFIVEPGDNRLILRRTEDFQMISEMDCPVVTQSSKIQFCAAGLVILENNRAFLLNQKKNS